MMSRPGQQKCQFSICCSQGLPREQQLSPFDFKHRNDKISLRRLSSRLSPPPPPLPTSPPRPHRPLDVRSPKPRIFFDWKPHQLQRTTKLREPVGAETSQLQLRETRVVRGLKDYRSSLISVGSEGEKGSAKFEESLIMVDYFHPSKQQLSSMQQYLPQEEGQP